MHAICWSKEHLTDGFVPSAMISALHPRGAKLVRELLRVVRTPDGAVIYDPTGKANGRGAYVCRSVECLKKARKARRLERVFSSQIPDEVYDMMEKELEPDA